MPAWFSGKESEMDDREFMTALYREFERAMYAAAYKYTSDPQAAEDIVQDSVVSILRKIDTVRPLEKRALAAYVAATVRNASINRLRRQGYERVHMQEDAEEEINRLPADISLEDLVFLSDRLEQLSKIWPELSPEDRFLLEGKYILGYTDQELAEEAACKPDSVRMKLTRARRNALSLLKREGVEHYDEA